MIPKPSLGTGTVTPAWHQQLGKATAHILSVLPPCQGRERERTRRGGGKGGVERQCERRRRSSILRRIGGYFLHTCSPSRKLLIRQRKPQALPPPQPPTPILQLTCIFPRSQEVKNSSFYSDSFAVFQAWHLVWLGVVILTMEDKWWWWWWPMVIKRDF